MVEKLDLWQGHTLLLGYLLNITMGYGKSDMLSIEASILVCDIQMTCVLHLQATLMFKSCFWQAYNELIAPNAYSYLLSFGERVVLAFQCLNQIAGKFLNQLFALWEAKEILHFASILHFIASILKDAVREAYMCCLREVTPV